MKTIVYNGHQIQLPGASLTGKEEVKYDGKVVSSKHTVFGGTHVFRVKEDGEDVDYEVEIGTRWHGFSQWYVVRRNGKVIYTDR
jgi:hypothetical protein